MLKTLRVPNTPEAREAARRAIEDRPLAALLMDPRVSPEIAARAAAEVIVPRDHYARLLAGEAEGDRLDLGASETAPEPEAPEEPTAADLWRVLGKAGEAMAELSGIVRGLVAVNVALLRELGPTIDIEAVRVRALAGFDGSADDASAVSVVCTLTNDGSDPPRVSLPH